MFDYYQNLLLKARNLVPQKTFKMYLTKQEFLLKMQMTVLSFAWLVLKIGINLKKKTFQLCV